MLGDNNSKLNQLEKDISIRLVEEVEKSAMIRLWNESIELLLKVDIGEGKTPTANTIRKSLSKIRRYVKLSQASKEAKFYLLHEFYNTIDNPTGTKSGILTLPMDLVVKNNEAKTNSLLAKLASKQRIKRSQIQDFRQKCINIIDNAKNESTDNLILSLCFLTGRRSIEIIKVGDFKLVSKKSELEFCGQAKRKGKDEPYTIPVLYTNVLKGFKELQKRDEIKELKSLSEEQVNSLFGKRLNKATPLFVGECIEYIEGSSLNEDDNNLLKSLIGKKTPICAIDMFEIYNRYIGKDISPMTQTEISGAANRLFSGKVKRMFILEESSFEDLKRSNTKKIGRRKYFNLIKPISTVSPHDLRKMYNTYCLNYLLPKNKTIKEKGFLITDEKGYSKAILGHDNVETGRHYDKYILVD